MASRASCDSWLRKERFLRNPPPPFDYNSTIGERSRDDSDEDWLPDLPDLLSGNFNVLIDLTCDSDHECDNESFPESPRLDPAAVSPALYSAKAEPSPFSERPPGAGQPPKAVDCLDLDQVEIPESPGAIRASPAGSVQSRHHSDGDGGARSAAAAAAATQAIIASIETDGIVEEQRVREQKQEQEQEEDEWQETCSGGGGGLPLSGQLNAPMSESTIRLPESGMIPERPSPDAVPDRQLEIQCASQIVSPGVGRSEYIGCGPCVSIQDITFLRIEGQRETARGLEYRVAGKMWLQSGVNLPSDLLQGYRRGIAREDRLATLRTRKRTSGEVGLLEATRCSARKRFKRAQV